MASSGEDHGGTDLPRAYVRGAIERGRLAHAYLLLGPESALKRAFALDLARLIFCAARGSGAVPCGACAPCRAIAHQNHRSVTIYAPEEGKSAIDIATVREIAARSHLARDEPYVAILEGADSMQDAAASALLKTLEEPAGDFVLVLLAGSTGSVLPTIVSRCHRLYFRTEPDPAAGTVSEEVLAEISAPGFIADRDLKEWLAAVVPAETTNRDRVRVLIAELVARFRGLFEAAPAEELDSAIDRLETLLELHADLAAAVQPDLVLERVLGLLGVGIGGPHDRAPAKGR